MGIGRYGEREPPIYLFSFLLCSFRFAILLPQSHAHSDTSKCFGFFSSIFSNCNSRRPYKRPCIREHTCTTFFRFFSCPLAQCYPALSLAVTNKECLLHRGQSNTGTNMNIDKKCDNCLKHPNDPFLLLPAPELCAASAKPKQNVEHYYSVHFAIPLP